MLVLSRKRNETIHIGEEITLTVISVIGDKVRIGLDAPQEVKILRGEHLLSMAAAATSQEEHPTAA